MVLIIAAILVLLLVGVEVLWNAGKSSPEPRPPAETIEAPIDVRMTYNISDWTFEKKSGTLVSVRAIFYEGQDASAAAKNVCNLTLYSVDGVEHVIVTWQNGREVCER